MDAAEFRTRGKEMIDFVADYLETLRERPVIPGTTPGVLRSQLPQTPPEEPESWDKIMRDVDERIMPMVRIITLLLYI